MAQNVELKARLKSLKRAAAVARNLATDSLGTLRQTDTYFHASHGRLKLREISDSRSRESSHISGEAVELIWYQRPDETGSRLSEYYRLPLPAAEPLKQMLTDALGVIHVVEKTRQVFLYHNVRIHLDEVAGLGSFLEFEAVLDEQHDEASGRQMLEWLREQFGIAAEEIVAGSYVDFAPAGPRNS